MKDAYFPPEFLENDKRKPYGNDIALLILREGFQLVMGKIDVIPLPPKNYQPIGEIILFRFFLYRLTFFRNFHLFKVHSEKATKFCEISTNFLTGSNIIIGGDYAKFCGLLRMYEIYELTRFRPYMLTQA